MHEPARSDRKTIGRTPPSPRPPSPTPRGPPTSNRCAGVPPRVQLQLFHDYGSNPPLYPAWQAYFREHQPPTLIVWGDNDEIFPAAGAHPYKRDLENLEFHLIDTGHFALEEDLNEIAGLIRGFLASNVKSGTPVK